MVSRSNGKRRTPVARPLLRMRWGAACTPTPAEQNEIVSQVDTGSVFRFAGGRYTLGNEIGRGAHCVVWQCLRVSRTGEPHSFALKIHNEEATAVKREANALKALHATSMRPTLFPQLLGTVRVHGRTGLALSVHGPDLYQLQKQRDRKPFPASFVWTVATQLLAALRALEEVALIHVRPMPTGLDWTGLDWTGRDWAGRDWTGPGRDGTGRDGTGRDWTGRDWTRLD